MKYIWFLFLDGYHMEILLGHLGNKVLNLKEDTHKSDKIFNKSIKINKLDLEFKSGGKLIFLDSELECFSCAVDPVGVLKTLLVIGMVLIHLLKEMVIDWKVKKLTSQQHSKMKILNTFSVFQDT